VRAAGLIETRPAWAYEIEITDIREIIANSPKTPLRTFTEGYFTLPTTGSKAHPCFTMNRTATASRNSRPPEQARRPASFRSGGRRSLLSRGVCQAPRLATPEARGFLESASRKDYALTVRRQRQDNVAQASCGRRIELSLSTTRRSSHILMLPSGSRSGLKPTLPNGMVEAMASNAAGLIAMRTMPAR
jgi:hypothetical protein